MTERAAPLLDAVVFDLGGVCIDWDPRYLYRKLFGGDDAAMERFLAEVLTQDWNSELDAGRPWPEAIEALSRAHPESRPLIEAFRARWPETLGDAIAGTVDILADLHHSGVRLFALSNWSAETFALTRPRFAFLEWFEGIVISGEVGIRKPDPRIYRLLLERHELRPDGTVFVDDVAENVAAGAALGLVALQFRDVPGLRRDLARLGLLTGAVPSR